MYIYIYICINLYIYKYIYYDNVVNALKICLAI